MNDGPDERLTFDDVTTLAFCAVACTALAVVLLLGVMCAVHRIEAVVDLL